MLRRRLAIVLTLFASVVVLAAVLAAASLAVTERQVLRGRVASDIAAGFVQLSAQKQRLRTWVAQAQLGAQADSGARAELLAAMHGTLERLKLLSQQAADLDSSAEAQPDHRRRQDALALLGDSVAALERAVDGVRPLSPGVDAAQAWAALSRVFDEVDGRDLRKLIATNIAREAAAVQRERAAADATLTWVRWLWLGAAGCLASAAMGAAVYFGRALREPLHRLSQGAQALQAGELGHRIAVLGRDEFADVAQSVNALAAELEQHRERESAQRQRLEDLVAERTRALQDALAALRQADGQRRRLFADISHELRTPTTAIRGEAEITLRGVEKPASEYKEALQRILATARQLGVVIDDLLRMARSDAAQLHQALQPVDLDALLDEALAQASALAQRQGVRLLPAPERSAAHVVSADPVRLRQLLGVLLDNALRYSSPGGRVWVTVQAPGAGQPLRLSVHDEGQGIPPDELPHVFERQYRGALARQRNPEGSGLGLSIARELAQAQGGTLSLRSTGQGTQADLQLPTLPKSELDEAVT